jgi:hypothetical protein
MLALFAVIHAASMVAAYPLAPTMHREIAADLHSRKVGISHEPEVGVESHGCERLGESRNTGRYAAGPRVFVGTLEREDVELQGSLQSSLIARVWISHDATSDAYVERSWEESQPPQFG